MDVLLKFVGQLKGAASELKSEDGQTLAEYGMLLGAIVLVVIAAALVLGPAIANLFSSATSKF